MRSDVPYGAYLSGGNDSTLVVKCMTEHKEENKTFTAVIQDEELNEKEYADLGKMSLAEKKVLLVVTFYALGFIFKDNWATLLGVNKFVKDSTVAFFAAAA